MLSRRFYYALKPYLPWQLRMALRRLVALRQRAASTAVWPIDPATARPPAGWGGWPDGHAFSFVLTHDVEGPEGVAKCRQLAELELRLGFRSSFNFIPEGPYDVPPDLRRWLVDQGFEVGVHDLNHDGHLFASREVFAAKAERINRYCRDWGATGFRAGFMLRNLDWYHDLDISYDASTFDTDPFEPQPDGAGTIFPFLVPAPGGARPGRGADGYVELPYSLPQDSTLFLVLRESSPAIWFRKLDWVASHGGMALVNVHPDYLRFEGERPSGRTFPVQLYADLLEYVRRRHAGKYWHALPRNIAAHVRKTGVPSAALPTSPASPADRTAPDVTRPSPLPPPPRAAPAPMKARPYRIVMLLANSYPGDTRVRNEASLLAAHGYDVSVVCFAKEGQPRTEVIDGVRAYRFPRFELFEKTEAENMGFFTRLLAKVKVLVGYGFEYGYFTTACFLVTTYIFLRRGFDALHAHNPPDTLCLVGLPYRLLGKKYVFDHHDLCPELYQSRFRTGECLQTRILRAAEWGSLKIASITIATNESYKQVQIARGGRRPETVFIVRNGPSEHRMTPVPPAPRLRAMGRQILVYIGSLNPQDGVDYLIRSLHHLVRDVGRRDFYCVIMGSGDSLNDLRAQATALELNDYVELTGYVSEEDLQANLAAADICVDPDPTSPLNDVSTWIKIMEYMAFAKPIVTYDLKETRFSAQDAALYVPPNDELGFARAIAELMDAPDRRRTMGAFARRRVEETLQWSVVGQQLLEAYAYLQGRR